MGRRQFIRASLVSAITLAAMAGCSAGQESTAEAQGIYILYTSDVHCGIDQGFGFAGLQQLRDSLEAKGFATLLVDNGDHIQGETLGTLTQGESIIQLMNKLRYDVAIPGNHEFDYGMDRFFELVGMADFPYISCNFNKGGELVFEPYKIIEVAGKRIAFVGMTTPETITSSTPKYFQDDEGNLIYGFMQDDTGEALYEAVQAAVDAARAEGVDYVYALGHMGLLARSEPWTYADVIENTNGIDVFLDGHSHDTEQVVMKNKDGKDVPRSACGTKLNCIGYSLITPDGIEDTGIWSWPNGDAVPELFGLSNEMSEAVEAEMTEAAESTSEVVAFTNAELTINDPTEVDSSGNAIRMVRRSETNLGDLCADVVRDQTGADIGVQNGGGIRANIAKGDVTYGDIIAVFPFGNELCLIEATGQQILDALEWGVHSLPEEFGGFLQVSGLSYTVDGSVPSGCGVDADGMCTGISGERRVRDVKVGDTDLDPKAKYTVGGIDYVLLNNGDGNNLFNGATVLEQNIKVDNQALIDFIVDTLGGEIGADYADPYGQDRITFVG